MLQQIELTRHQDYLWQFYDYAEPPTPGRVDPVYGDDFPLRVVAPAFQLSELTTALVIGFYIYLPFLVIDLVVSAGVLDSVNDVPGALTLARRVLRPDGLFLAAMLGGDTLTELRESFAVAETALTGGVSPRVAPFPDLRDMGALLQRAGFALPVADLAGLPVERREELGPVLQRLRRMPEEQRQELLNREQFKSRFSAS